MGEGSWAAHFTSGFPSVGAILGEGVSPLNQGESPSISESDLPEGHPGRCTASMSAREAPRDFTLCEEALPQVAKGWLGGPYEFWRDAVLTTERESLRRNPSSRFGVPQGEKLRAAGDPKQSATNGAAQVPTPVTLPPCDHASSAIKSRMAKCSGRPLGFAETGPGDV